MFSNSCFATIVTIEADDFAAGQNMSSPVPDVTLWESYRKQDSILDLDYIFAESYADVYATASTDAGKPLGDNVIGNTLTLAEYWIESPYLFVEINGFARSFSVSSAPRPNWISSSCVLDLYDENGIRIGHNFVSTGSTVTSVLPGYSARYAFIYSTNYLAVDHIVIDYIPEPATLLLLGLGAIFLRKHA